VHDSIGESGATRRRSHAAAPRSQVPSGEKAAFTLCSHRTPRHGRYIRESGDDNSRPQRDDRAERVGARLGAGICSMSTPGPSAPKGLGPAHPATTPRALRAPLHALAAFPPAASFPLDPPTWACP
jgi:hypothetical protein